MKQSIKKRKTYSLKLTKYELIHLRDVLSVSLPPDGKKTISESLAELEGRSFVESNLWNKIVEGCKSTDLPVDDEAPDYVVVTVSQPQMSVFQVASSPDEEEVEEE